MKKVKIVRMDPYFLEEIDAVMPVFGKDDYVQRLELLGDRMVKRGVSHVVVYADREHFANMDYLIGFEPRFEEAILIIDRDGNKTIVSGNECIPYSHVSPVDLKRVLYQNFSLQGQPRDKSKSLNEIFSDAGIHSGTKVGLVGYKYFEQGLVKGNPDYLFDIPSYVLEELRSVAGIENVVNFTREFTGMPDGLRMTVRTAKEVAWAEYAACKTTNVIQRLFKNIKPGIGELELSEKGKPDFSPISVFPMLNFGREHGAIGLRSPNNDKLSVGDPCGLCYGMRGSLVSRVGIAAYGEDSLKEEYQGVIDSFYKPFWSAIAIWYESLYIGVSAAEVYENVMKIIGGSEFGVVLNPGHYIGGDEWVNSPFCRESPIKLENPAHMQCDIIAGSSSPAMSGICEDSVIIADADLRNRVAREYPDVWARISKRQRLMREILGIRIHDDLLPLGNLNGVYFPYMLSTGLIFAFE